MLGDWFRTVEIPMTREAFAALPRSGAYRYAYLDGTAVITPRPEGVEAVLDLAAFTRKPRPTVALRPLEDADWPALPAILAASHAEIPPFATLSDADRLSAAAATLALTRAGGRGLIAPDACLVATLPGGRILGAILITLKDASVAHSETPDSPRAPMLSWIFVDPRHTAEARHGVGTSLLAAAVEALRSAGHTRLTSSFLAVNHGGALWHWAMGFKLVGGAE